MQPDPENEVDTLARLVFGMTRDELELLRRQVEDRSQFTDYVSHALSEAVNKASANQNFQHAMSPVVEGGVMRTARQRPAQLGEALVPAMGPAIRGMISTSLAKMNQRVETTLQSTFSLQGLKWRLESKRTGQPLADIIVREMMVFRVEHVLLIHQETGALLAESSLSESIKKDSSVLSSMLTAVRDFVTDTFGQGDAGVAEQTYTVGALTAHIVVIGDLALAAMVKGTPTATLKEKVRETLEQICLNFGEAAHEFSGDTAPFENAQPILDQCVIEEHKKKSDADPAHHKKPKSKKTWPIIGALALLLMTALALLWYFRAQQEANWNDFEEALRSNPGTVVLSVERESTTLIHVMQDPDALSPERVKERFPKISDEVRFLKTPYLSLAPELSLKRLTKLFSPPSTISLKYQNGVFKAQGSASAKWLEQAQFAARFLSHEVIDLDEVVVSTEVDELSELLSEIEIDFALKTTDLSADGLASVRRLKNVFARAPRSTEQTWTVDVVMSRVSSSSWLNSRRASERFKTLSEALKPLPTNLSLEFNTFILKDFAPEERRIYATFRLKEPSFE